MSSTTSVQKTLYYYHADFLQRPHSGTLQSMLERSLKVFPKNIERRQFLDAHKQHFMLLNHHEHQGGMIFGNLVSCELGTNHTLVKLDDDAPSLEIQQIALTKDEDGKRREFLESILYFCIKGNHLILLQSPTLKLRQLESYLNWLFTNSKAMTTNDWVTISPQPSQKAFDAIAKAPVKKVRVESAVMNGVEIPSNDDVTESNTPLVRGKGKISEAKKLRFSPKAHVMELLKVLIGATEFNKLELNKSSEENAHLQLALEFSYNRSTTEQGQKILNQIAVACRHLDESDLELELKGGGTLHGKELKLFLRLSVATLDGVVNMNDLFPQMRDMLLDYIKRGLIEP